MRDLTPTNRELIDLRDKRTDLTIRISLLKDSEIPDAKELFELQRDLDLLDLSIASQSRSPYI